MAYVSVRRLLCIAFLCVLTIPSIQVASELIPSESECRPYIERALNTVKADNKDIESASSESLTSPSNANDDISKENSEEKNDVDLNDAVVSDDNDVSDENRDEIHVDDVASKENSDVDSKEHISEDSEENAEGDSKEQQDDDSKENIEGDSKEDIDDDSEDHLIADSKEDNSQEQVDVDSNENPDGDSKEQVEDNLNTNSDDNSQEQLVGDSKESDSTEQPHLDSKQTSEVTSQEQQVGDSTETAQEQVQENDDSIENTDGDSKEQQDVDSTENTDVNSQEQPEGDSNEGESQEQQEVDLEENVVIEVVSIKKQSADQGSSTKELHEIESNEVSTKSYPVDDLLMEAGIPENRRDRSHIDEILRLDEDSLAQNEALQKTAEVTLNNLKKIYENAIKPLETLYKYRDLSNRHFGDSEIFSKPLILFMGPWSGGKSSILNYLTDNEYTEHSLRTGAEPSPAYFNILMYGDSPEVLDGTQLAADWTFSGLQKFGQGLQDRLRGLKLPSNILKKVNIVEIPGILEVRKQVSRVFPFNDACQWFIDRADIIFLVYDPSKLDVGPETEAILDQLKGREYQTRILLNKADIIHAEELLRVQSALIWNISPLMSSAQPPVMYTTSLWSNPYQENAPVRLLQAQEKALLQDLSQAIEHRIENKIAGARRFAVRVRNHAKMVDCYLTTYYNHKTLFGNKKKISGEIVEHPQNYHIYEGLSTLTNISRYDLPDPEVYRDFFRLNPLYEFKKLSETCTYFRGCPINKLDVAIAYDLPELVNRYKRAKEQALITLELENANETSTTTSTSTTTATKR